MYWVSESQEVNTPTAGPPGSSVSPRQRRRSEPVGDKTSGSQRVFC